MHNYWYATRVGGEEEALIALGFIPTFLLTDDPRPAIDQFKERYVGGWSPQSGFILDKIGGTLKYPGDPDLQPLAFTKFRDELITVYDFGYVCVWLSDDSFEVSRMD